MSAVIGHVNKLVEQFEFALLGCYSLVFTLLLLLNSALDVFVSVSTD